MKKINTALAYLIPAFVPAAFFPGSRPPARRLELAAQINYNSSSRHRGPEQIAAITDITITGG